MLPRLFSGALFLISLISPTQTQTIPIDNEIMEEPAIECDAEHVTMRFKTRAPFQGHVFVDGNYKKRDCHKDFALNRDNGGFLQIPFSAGCGLRRQRRALPKGLQLSAPVVVSFHRAFITGADRVYHVLCIYKEEDYTVSHGLTVSMLPTIEITAQPSMPACRYEVLGDGPSGPPIRFARVGDKVFHKWTCKHDIPGEMYCMVIHSCAVDDGGNTSYELIDRDGCSKDPTALEDLIYMNDLTAGIESAVFKFADKPHVYFNCQVQLSLKQENQGECPRPRCGIHRLNQLRHRFKRMGDYNIIASVNQPSVKYEWNDTMVDVQAQPLLVLDLEDSMDSNPIFNSKYHSISSARENFAERGDICLSYAAFGTLTGAVVIVSLVGLFSVFIACIRSRY